MLCRQILKGISLSPLETLCSEVIIGNLLMVKNQETSCCVQVKYVPLPNPQNQTQPTFMYDAFDVMHTDVWETSFLPIVNFLS